MLVNAKPPPQFIDVHSAYFQNVLPFLPQYLPTLGHTRIVSQTFYHTLLVSCCLILGSESPSPWHSEHSTNSISH